MASYGGLEGILTGRTKSTDHPSSPYTALVLLPQQNGRLAGALREQFGNYPPLNYPPVDGFQQRDGETDMYLHTVMLPACVYAVC